ncbi:MAG: hypothetical protein HOD63_12125 [Bacteroidetes bacterium]|nr:hypothetical protein [Bacteroidota bacterium]
MKKSVLLALLISAVLQLSAQHKLIEGNMSPEVKGSATTGHLFLVVKEYQELNQKSKKKVNKAGPMTYLDLPLDATNVSLSGNLFTTKLICFQGENVKWTKDIGMTNTSFPTGIATDTDGNVYTGEKNADGESISLYKFNKEGEELWSAKFDSLYTLHEIFVNEDENLTTLVSFTYSEKIESGNTYSYKEKFIYETLTVNRNSGKRMAKESNQGPSYYCGIGFSNPTLQTHRINYFFLGDTLVYSRNDTLKMLTVSMEELADHDIIDVIGEESAYIVLCQNRETGNYKLLINRWAEGSELEKIIKLSISPHAKIVKLMKNELNGVSIFYTQNNQLKMLKVSNSLEIINDNNTLTKASVFEFISDIIIDSNGGITLVGLNAVNGLRTIFLKEI